MLTISREEFLEIYKGLPICDSVDLFYAIPKSDMDLLTNYLPSKLWRLNNLYKIVNKQGQRIKFRMNRSQHIVYAASLRHPRIIILKSRQQGISTLWLVSFFDDAVTRKDHSIGLMAQGTDEASTLLERVKILWEELHPAIKSHLHLDVEKDNTKEFSLSNDSCIFIRTSFRSTTLQRLHISEMGKIANKSPEKAEETKTGTLQALAAGNTGVVESTAEGDNAFKEMWDIAYTFTGLLSPGDFMAVFLSWLEDPDCKVFVPQTASSKQVEYFEALEKELNRVITPEQRNFWITKYRELGDRIYQEYPSTPVEAFRATKEGTYYAESYVVNVINQGREVENLYDPNLDVTIAVDLGRNDANVILVYQNYLDQWRIIDEYVDSNLHIKPYCDWIKKQPWFSNLVEVALPWDAEVRSLTDNKTRTEVFIEELSYIIGPDGQRQAPPRSIYVYPLEKGIREDGINGVRGILPSLWIDRKCTYIKSCFLNYRKEWNDKKQIWRDIPFHDTYSNGADAVRYMVEAGNKYRNIELDVPRRTSHRLGGMDV